MQRAGPLQLDDPLHWAAELPIMEDFELVRRLRRLGRIEVVPAHVVTSARPWRTLGAWRTTWINQKIVLGYYLGISPQRMAAWYRRDGDGGTAMARPALRDGDGATGGRGFV